MLLLMVFAILNYPLASTKSIKTCLLEMIFDGVDTFNFMYWYHDFVSYAKRLTTNGRKCLFNFDGFYTHLNLCIETI